MTNQHHDQSEGEAFDDFLQGRGELVKQLKALAQQTPSAALDAAILASAKAAIAQSERAKQAAANDPISPHKQNFLSRFKMPLAMAAGLMVAVLVTMQWHAQQEVQAPIQVAQAPAAEPAPAPAATLPQLVQADTKEKPALQAQSRGVPVASPPMRAATPTRSIAESKAQASEKKLATPIAANPPVASAAVKSTMANEAAKPTAERVDEPPTHLAQADTSQMKFKSSGIQPGALAVPAASVHAPAPAATPAARSLAMESAKAAAVPAPAAPPEAPAKAESQDRQKAWLAHIEELIKADSRKDALAEWEKFEKAYPDYPVPEKLKAQIKSLKN